ncbi:PIG-X [Scheffersomyces coipomensis]|uniref:PIG-X n=1 Tax=Scheffersomyces coipomensis TaxID=1788519 RepID=UPI00315DF469
MIKQRTTIFNPKDTNDDVVSKITREKIVIQTDNDENEPFILENKITLPSSAIATTVNQFNLIKQLRIQSNDDSIKNDTVFTYKFSNGVNVYVIPKNVETKKDQEQFFEQVNVLLNSLLGIDVKTDNWIKTINSLYYHDDISKRLDLTWFQDASDEIQDSSETYDLVFNNEDGNPTIVLKQLTYLPPSEEFSISLNEKVRKEVGLFIIDKHISTSDDIVLSGLRVIFDKEEQVPAEEGSKEEDYIFKTLFHIKPRHRFIDSTSTSSIVKNGLHPILKSNFQSFTDIQEVDILECSLYYYINLNKSLIFDKYQSIPSGSSLVVHNGVSNLELPEYKITEWGSEILFEFNNISQDDIEFTLHSRYQSPNEIQNATVVNNSLPEIFYGCNVKDDFLLDKSPFDSRLEIGGNYERYFTDNTVFYHLTHTPQSSVTIDVPNATGSIETISTVTLVSVLFGVAIIIYTLLGAFFNGHRNSVTFEKKNE